MPRRQFARRFRSSVKNGAPAISVGNINFNEDHPYPVVEFLTRLFGYGTMYWSATATQPVPCVRGVQHLVLSWQTAVVSTHHKLCKPWHQNNTPYHVNWSSPLPRSIHSGVCTYWFVYVVWDAEKPLQPRVAERFHLKLEGGKTECLGMLSHQHPSLKGSFSSYWWTPFVSTRLSLTIFIARDEVIVTQ